jgi:tRNA G37 N-methylase Trm5
MSRIRPAALALLCVVTTSVSFAQIPAPDAGKVAEPKPKLDVPFVPTPHDVVEKMLELVAVTTDDLVYDLGCGDGRIVVAAAKKYGCRAVGFDIDPRRIKESLENVAQNRVGHRVKIEKRSIFEVDLRPATVVTMYLLPDVNRKLLPQLQKLKPGSRIVSHSFSMKGIKPDKIVRVKSKKDKWTHTIYLWTTPLKAEEKDED